MLRKLPIIDPGVLPEVPKDLRDSKVLQEASEDPEGTPPSKSEANQKAAVAEVNSLSTLPAWVRNRAADCSTSPPSLELEKATTSGDLLTVGEAASILRISDRTLRRHLAGGKIPHIRVGRQVRIPRKSLTVGW
jgi:excisionase family DNA binding protein